MSTYTAKTLIDGFKVKTWLKGRKLVAVPQSKVSEGLTEVILKDTGETMQIRQNKIPLTVISFPDKFNRGAYSLYY